MTPVGVNSVEFGSIQNENTSSVPPLPSTRRKLPAVVGTFNHAYHVSAVAFNDAACGISTAAVEPSKSAVV